MQRKILVFFACLLLSVIVTAQSALRFPLEKHTDGHYYFKADVYGQQAEIMLESGIPALLIGRDFYEKNMKGGELKFDTSASRMRLMNRVYQISYRATGKVNVGGAVYDGPVFILERFGGISLPVQHLKESQSGKRIVTVDLKDQYMSVGGSVPTKGEKYKITMDRQTGRPYVNSYFFIEGHQFDGRLLVDLGNPMLLFLFSQHHSLKSAVSKGVIELHDAYDGQGRRVSQGFQAKNIKLFGRDYGNMTVGVTDQYRSAKELGFLGTPFFDSPVVFDFDKGWMYK